MQYTQKTPTEGNDSETILEEMSKEEKFFKYIEITEFDKKDPSLLGQYFNVYEEEIPFELRIEDGIPPDDSIFVKLLFKILINVKNNIVKIEVFYNKDLFFYYKAEINLETFYKLKESQKLLQHFQTFPDLIGKYLDLCMNETERYLGVFNIYKDKSAKMEIIENLNYKFAQILMINFVRCTNDLDIRRQIIFRYNSLKKMYNIAKNRINIINSVLKENNSKLIPEIKNEVSKVKIDTVIRNKPLYDDSPK